MIEWADLPNLTSLITGYDSFTNVKDFSLTSNNYDCSMIIRSSFS